MIFWTCWAYVLSFLACWAYVLSSKVYVPSSWAPEWAKLACWAPGRDELLRAELLAWWTPTCWTPGVVDSYVLDSWGVVDSYMLNKILLVSLPVNVMGIPIPVGEKSSSHTIPLFKQKEKGQKEKIVYFQCKNKIYSFLHVVYFFIPCYFLFCYSLLFFLFTRPYFMCSNENRVQIYTNTSKN